MNVGSREAVARVEREGEHATTWAIRILWDGTAYVYVGGYPSPAHARFDLGTSVAKALRAETAPKPSAKRSG